jgi:hypothetical protein
VALSDLSTERGEAQGLLDLGALHAHQRIAALEGVIHEGERRVLAEAHQPEAQPGQVHRKRVLVHPIQTALGNQPARIQQWLLAMGTAIRLQRLWQALAAPCQLQKFRQEAAALHQEGP